ncbi:MAG TPA: MOSC domain-containing protein [Terriglobia bacterium]|nr:MOSC domain-containing protein [Terriglobia bacterium]
MLNPMKVLSINVGRPSQVVWRDQAVLTGIYKVPVRHRVKVTKLNIDGDVQADLTVHGAPNKAVYAYPSEHYEYWRQELPGVEIPWGMFGENLTVAGLMESDAHVGDRLRIGTAVLMLTQPRLPCYKLGIKFGCDDMPDRFLASRRTGFYFAVVEEGEIGKGDHLELIHQDVNRISIADILHLLYDHEPQNPELFEKALRVDALSPSWRKRLLKRLDRPRP